MVMKYYEVCKLMYNLHRQGSEISSEDKTKNELNERVEILFDAFSRCCAQSACHSGYHNFYPATFFPPPKILARVIAFVTLL
jgi:hypothetical protein